MEAKMQVGNAMQKDAHGSVERETKQEQRMYRL